MIALGVGVLGTAEAQQQVRYFSRSGVKQVTAEEAYFFEVTKEDASGGGTKTRYQVQDSTKVSQHTYSDLDGGKYKSGILDGPRYEWYPNGNLKEEGLYSNNKLNGTYKAWYESGELRYSKKYKDNQPHDSLTAYYKAGNVRRVEVYEGGKMTSGKVYDEAGKEVKYIPMEQIPLFPGGEHAMLRWLGSNIKYPKSMRKARLAGLVVIAFTVDEEGNLSNIELLKGIHPDGDAEALRVIKSMPTWNPGLLEGEPVTVRYTLPIRYSI
ncbi:hypothetical protein GCM10007389_16480 [Pontibacter akesuensis]|nr:hypothetical protein GCM10007389_16480 [Pontibacter akesuensis]